MESWLDRQYQAPAQQMFDRVDRTSAQNSVVGGRNLDPEYAGATSTFLISDIWDLLPAITSGLARLFTVACPQAALCRNRRRRIRKRMEIRQNACTPA